MESLNAIIKQTVDVPEEDKGKKIISRLENLPELKQLIIWNVLKNSYTRTIISTISAYIESVNAVIEQTMDVPEGDRETISPLENLPELNQLIKWNEEVMDNLDDGDENVHEEGLNTAKKLSHSIFIDITAYLSRLDIFRKAPCNCFQDCLSLEYGRNVLDSALIPSGTSTDWMHALICMEQGQYDAGAMLALRALEGMTRHFYKTIKETNPALAQMWQKNDKKSNSGDDDQSSEPTWAQMKNNLEIYFQRTDPLQKSRWELLKDIRNKNAHGAANIKEITVETANTILIQCRIAILDLVELLKVTRKALWVAVPYEAELSTAVALWMMDRFCGGVAVLECRDQKRQTNGQWSSYTIGLGDIFDAEGNNKSPIMQKVFDELIAGQEAQNNTAIQAFIDRIKNLYPPSEDKNTLSLHSIVKKLPRDINGTKNHVRYLHNMLSLIDYLYSRDVNLMDETVLMQIQNKFCRHE